MEKGHGNLSRQVKESLMEFEISPVQKFSNRVATAVFVEYVTDK